MLQSEPKSSEQSGQPTILLHCGANAQAHLSGQVKLLPAVFSDVLTCLIPG